MPCKERSIAEERMRSACPEIRIGRAKKVVEANLTVDLMVPNQ